MYGNRTNAQHRTVQITPTRFAPAHEGTLPNYRCGHEISVLQNAHDTCYVNLSVGVGAVVVCDQDVYATATGTPICRRGETYFEASPATAFLCSPQTTRFITQQEGNSLSRASLTDSGERNVSSNVRRLSFSLPTRLPADDASLVTENVDRSLFDAYTYSPTPVVLSSNPHQLSVSSIRPIVLYV